MSVRILALTALLSILLTAAPASIASADHQATGDPYFGSSLCLPDAYLDLPVDCLALGPSQTLTDLAKKGLTFPPRPLSASAPPSALTQIPSPVARINVAKDTPALIYGSIDDARANNNPLREIPAGAGLRYVSYIQATKVDGKWYVQLKTGEWMRASPSGYSYFQGLAFQKTPPNDFGWVIDRIHARSAPSWNAPEVGDEIAQNSVVQIYDSVQAEDMEWYQIGMDRWVPWQKSRIVHPNTTPPQGVTGDRWIAVDLYNQTLTVYEHHQLVFATLIASGGKPFYTRPGLFKIYQKKPLETMSGAFEVGKTDYYYLEDVPWTMYFDQARALHGAYWRPWFGLAGTHGCVNLSIGDSAWLYQWANEGDPVYVWDPSGETPTDPSLYGAGGA